jgi:hypothetical protein
MLEVTQNTIETNTAETPGEITAKLTCTDSDGGENYFEKGTAIRTINQETLEIKTDYCNNQIKNYNLVEMICSNNSIIEIKYNCPHGCDDGQCIQEIPLPTVIQEGELPIEQQKGNEYYQESTENNTLVEEIELPVEEIPSQNPIIQSNNFIEWIMNLFEFT